MIHALLFVAPPTPPAPHVPTFARSVAVARPPLFPAIVAPPRAYRATSKAGPARDETVAVVKGRTVRFRPTEEFDRWRVEGVGRDGTVLLYRSYYGLYTTSRYSIVRGKVETPVRAWGHPAFVDVYRDARNYAGGFYSDDHDAGGVHPPYGPRNAFVVENGKARVVGLGTVKSWAPRGAVVTELSQDASGKPTNWEEEGETHSHVVEGGHDFDLAGLTFFFRRADGGLVFFDGEGLYLWRDRRLQPWAKLPRGWRPFALGPSGDLLVRNEQRLGVLRGRTLTPLALGDRRVGTALAGFPEVEWVRRDGSFAFSAPDDDSTKSNRRTVYTLTPARRVKAAPLPART